MLIAKPPVLRNQRNLSQDCLRGGEDSTVIIPVGTIEEMMIAGDTELARVRQQSDQTCSRTHP